MQSLSYLAAPLLYVMPEPDAFSSLIKLVRTICPYYFIKSKSTSNPGTVNGSRLFDRLLKSTDPKLWSHIRNTNTETIRRTTTHSSSETSSNGKDDNSLNEISNNLANAQIQKQMNLMYCFKHIMSAGMIGYKKIEEVLPFFDLIISFGYHMVILFTLARFILNREKLLKQVSLNLE